MRPFIQEVCGGARVIKRRLEGRCGDTENAVSSSDLGRWWLRTALRRGVQGVDAKRRLMGALVFCMFNHGFCCVIAFSWLVLILMITAMSPVPPRSPPLNRFDQYKRNHSSPSRQRSTPQKRYIQYNPSGPKIRDWRKQPSPTKRCRSPTSEPSTDKKDLPSPKRVKKLSPSV
ncbi:hypothetical protein FOZ63_008621, partial [Perkinsus olseni]